MDSRKKISPGYKFNEWEMKGVPIRIEVGQRDINNNSIFVARRDTNEKKSININDGFKKIQELINDIQDNLFNTAKRFRDDNTFVTNNYSEFKNIVNSGGFVECGWDGKIETEDKIKKETKATIRCIPFNNNAENLKCIYTQELAKYRVIFAKAY